MGWGEHIHSYCGWVSGLEEPNQPGAAFRGPDEPFQRLSWPFAFGQACLIGTIRCLHCRSSENGNAGLHVQKWRISRWWLQRIRRSRVPGQWCFPGDVPGKLPLLICPAHNSSPSPKSPPKLRPAVSFLELSLTLQAGEAPSTVLLEPLLLTWISAPFNQHGLFMCSLIHSTNIDSTACYAQGPVPRAGKPIPGAWRRGTLLSLGESREVFFWMLQLSLEG